MLEQWKKYKILFFKKISTKFESKLKKICINIIGQFLKLLIDHVKGSSNVIKYIPF